MEELSSYRKSITDKILELELKKQPYAKELITLLKELGMILILATI